MSKGNLKIKNEPTCQIIGHPRKPLEEPAHLAALGTWAIERPGNPMVRAIEAGKHRAYLPVIPTAGEYIPPPWLMGIDGWKELMDEAQAIAPMPWHKPILTDGRPSPATFEGYEAGSQWMWARALRKTDRRFAPDYTGKEFAGLADPVCPLTTVPTSQPVPSTSADEVALAGKKRSSADEDDEWHKVTRLRLSGGDEREREVSFVRGSSSRKGSLASWESDDCTSP
ncbi:hypothetical protein BDY19DRAFT_968456 [Irpex rosettiformis]|uniref:Uncharacterized protein n=1 Tax=Irpex rosettiformis TaxID=378272 RepID=A0ACB8TS04_9APHY|nr:hypothetical protein BDY19DRAFT_968456 [Irpex rosettiformis]